MRLQFLEMSNWSTFKKNDKTLDCEKYVFLKATVLLRLIFFYF